MTGKWAPEDRLQTSQSKKSSIGLIMKVMMIHWRLKSERAPNYKCLVKQSRGVSQSVFYCRKMNPQVRGKGFHGEDRETGQELSDSKNCSFSIFPGCLSGTSISNWEVYPGDCAQLITMKKYLITPTSSPG